MKNLKFSRRIYQLDNRALFLFQFESGEVYLTIINLDNTNNGYGGIWFNKIIGKYQAKLKPNCKQKRLYSANVEFDNTKFKTETFTNQLDFVASIYNFVNEHIKFVK